MKKNFFVFAIGLVFLFNVQVAKAVTIGEAAEFFNYFTGLANSYSSEMYQYYSPNAIIKRFLIKADGSRVEHVLQTEQYLKKLRVYSKLAGLKGYKNLYTGVSYKKVGDKVLITGTRVPSTSKTEKFPFAYLVTKNQNGKWEVLEDITDTKNAAMLK